LGLILNREVVIVIFASVSLVDARVDEEGGASTPGIVLVVREEVSEMVVLLDVEEWLGAEVRVDVLDVVEGADNVVEVVHVVEEVQVVEVDALEVVDRGVEAGRMQSAEWTGFQCRR